MFPILCKKCYFLCAARCIALILIILFGHFCAYFPIPYRINIPTYIKFDVLNALCILCNQLLDFMKYDFVKLELNLKPPNVLGNWHKIMSLVNQKGINKNDVISWCFVLCTQFLVEPYFPYYNPPGFKEEDAGQMCCLCKNFLYLYLPDLQSSLFLCEQALHT